MFVILHCLNDFSSKSAKLKLFKVFFIDLCVFLWFLASSLVVPCQFSCVSVIVLQPSKTPLGPPSAGASKTSKLRCRFPLGSVCLFQQQICFTESERAWKL